MENQIRALIILFKDYTHHGIESYLNGLLPKLVERNVTPTLLVLGSIEASARDFLTNAGVEVVTRPVHSGSSPIARLAKRRARRIAIREVLSEGNFDVIHANTSGPAYHHIALTEAYRAGVPIRIPHGHSADPQRNLHLRLLMPLYRRTIGKYATFLLACSEAAGLSLYGKKLWQTGGIIAKNGIDTHSFKPDQEARDNVRKGLEDAFLVGFVGRLAHEKNPSKLLGAFEAVLRIDPSAQLWLVGDGSLRKTLEQEAHDLGIAEHTVFWGSRKDVPSLLQGMDCLVMPSLFEGLPFSLLEAQAAGLPCIISDTIDELAVIPGCPTVRLPLEATNETWAQAIIEQRSRRIADGASRVRDAGFDVRESSVLIERLYRGIAPNR